MVGAATFLSVRRYVIFGMIASLCVDFLALHSEVGAHPEPTPQQLLFYTPEDCPQPPHLHPFSGLVRSDCPACLVSLQGRGCEPGAARPLHRPILNPGALPANNEVVAVATSVRLPICRAPPVG